RRNREPFELLAFVSRGRAGAPGRDVGSVVSGVFFFQAEDGIRDFHVTGVQTCALPIWGWGSAPARIRWGWRPDWRGSGGWWCCRWTAWVTTSWPPRPRWHRPWRRSRRADWGGCGRSPPAFPPPPLPD